MAQITAELVFLVGILDLLKAPSLQRRADSNGYVVLKPLKIQQQNQHQTKLHQYLVW